MAKKSKNKLIFPLVMVAVLSVMVVALLLLKNHNNAGNDTETGEQTETVVAFQRSGVIVTKMSFKGKEEDLSFVYENDLWYYEADKNYPVDSDSVDLMADNLMTVEAQLKVDTEGADTDSFGLGDTAEIITATYSDGRCVEFKFGIVNSYNGYQYFTYTDSPDVYLVSPSVLSAFEIELKDVYKSESCQLVVDGAKAENVTSVLISTAGGQQNAITDEKGCSALFNIMNYFNLSVWEDYYADETEMKETYGISKEGDRATINYTLTNYKEDENGEYVPYEIQKSYTVYFGNEFSEVEDTESGEDAVENWRTFYTVEGSNVVYSVSRENVESLFKNLTYTPDSTEDTEKEEATIE